MIRKRREFYINPIDTKPKTAVGIKLPIGGPGVFQLSYTTREQRKSNIKNFLMTNRGERPMNPEFGADLRSLLFENITNFEEEKQTLLERINLFFPEIVSEDLEFAEDPENSAVYVKLNYSYNDQEDEAVVMINKQK